MIYSSYTNRVKDIVAQKRAKADILKAYNSATFNLSDSFDGKRLIEEQRLFSKKIQLSASALGNLVHSETMENARLGQHPDFVHLKGTSNTEYHYIVSVFIDIQGSTNLHGHYGLPDIFRITNTIQSAAIHTCIALGGHVQRLQGDGVFAYFGGKNMPKEKAVELAVTACSMFSYFVENDLKNVFLEDGIENINTRTGIDFGDDDDVLWANFGVMDVSELTTNSLHTSLASKMQQWANRNGIVVGQYIKDKMGVHQALFDLVRNSQGEVVKRYIFEIPSKPFRYTQYAFDWYGFLKSLPFVTCNSDGTLAINENPQDRLAMLRNTASLISAGKAYADKYGNITPDSSGVHHEPHRFHYE